MFSFKMRVKLIYANNVDAAESRKMHKKTKRIIFVFSELNFILSPNKFYKFKKFFITTTRKPHETRYEKNSESKLHAIHAMRINPDYFFSKTNPKNSSFSDSLFALIVYI